MRYNVINFLRTAFPFLVTVFLWRLSNSFWNPAGILALIPIFFCTFVMRIPWFPLFGVLFCFLIDYNFATLPFWTTLFIIVYSINGFQTFTDVSSIDYNAAPVFWIFFGIGLVLLFFYNITWTNFARALLLFIWCGGLYIPVTKIIQRVHND